MNYEIFYAEPYIAREYSAVATLVAGLSSGRSVTHDDVYKAASSHQMFAAYDERGEIVGVATLVTVHLVGRTKGIIEDVVVSKRHRGEGIGEGLMRKVIWFGKESGHEYLDLTSSPERRGAHSLYRKLGFEKRDTLVYRMKL